MVLAEQPGQTTTDDDGFESSVKFLENLHKPLADEDLARASTRKTLTKGFLKKALSESKVRSSTLFISLFELKTKPQL